MYSFCVVLIAQLTLATLVRVMTKTVITCYLRSHSHVVPLQNVMAVCDCMYTQRFVLVKIVHMKLIHQNLGLCCNESRAY